MSKVASYLRGHLSGEVSTRPDLLAALSTDAGVLSLKPELVIYPRTTNDIRKVARFSWQLAEKGHALSITARGAGTDVNGSAIGKGIMLVLPGHMRRVYEFDPKQRLIRLQPGASVDSVAQALSLQGQHIPALFGSIGNGTVGGALASGVVGPLAGKYGPIIRAVDQLEVVLANGDIIQTGRVSKRELGKLKGTQGFIGDIYRGIDTILEENADLLDTLRSDDATGYNSVADVKQSDGSFDLTPLFIGSQGTLGIISEMIMKSEPKGDHYAIGAYVYEKTDEARDAFDELCRLDPAFIDYFDAELFETAADGGKQYEFYAKASESFRPAAVILMGFDDTSDRQRAKHLKKLRKIAEKTGTYLATASNDDADEMLGARNVTFYTQVPDKADHAAPAIFGGFQVPGQRFEDFYNSLQALSDRLKIALPLSGHVYTGVYTVYPSFDLKKVGDKQKLFKLLDELSQLVLKHSGSMISEGGEGRLKAKFIYPHLDPRLVEMYSAIRKVFDPRGIFNQGVKEQEDVRKLAEMTRSSTDSGNLHFFG